ncbi:MAG: AbrB family transcriptional regulator [Alphaproteobacteria bacterium]|nr:AbrB family transcriptional regulator [Alphaproteobacteria bacterium]MBU2379541.1 AbrB family transcriptional regulator [Alphaproteobacteria bacterium]
MRIDEVAGAPLRMSQPWQWGALVATSAVLVVILKAIQAPAALLLGPMAVGVAFGLKGATIRPAPVVFGGAQALVGCMIAMSATPGFYVGVVAHLPVYLGLAVSTLAITSAFGWVMSVRGWLPGTTAIWGLAPGASTAMVLMSEAFGGDRRLVAMIQYLRVLLVALVAMVLAQMTGAAPGHPQTDWLAHGDLGAVALTLAFAAAAGWVGKVSRIPAGIFLVPMLVGSALQATGVLQLQLPVLVTALAYAVVGWSIGLGFTRAAVIYSARMLPRILAVLALLLASCGLLAIGVSTITGVDLLSAYLATSPGGTDTILIIATSTPVDLPFILGGQLVRFLMVLAVGPILARALTARLASPAEVALPVPESIIAEPSPEARTHRRSS